MTATVPLVKDPKRQLFPALLVVSLWLAMPWVRAADSPPEPLTTANEILSLTDELAGRRLKIAVSGVVTAAEFDWQGQFFLQDTTGGVFVENLSANHPKPGDVVTVSGVSHPGAFAPIISDPVWQSVGSAPLPVARVVPIEDLDSGVHDGLRVEVGGVVRAARREPSRLTVYLAVAGKRIQVCAPPHVVAEPNGLIGARVLVRGTTATQYLAALRHLTGVAVYVPRADDFEVLAAEAVDPFAQLAIPLNRVAQYRRGANASTRVHVRGRVSYHRPGETIFLQDESGGLRIECEQTESLNIGEEVDVAGFLEYESHLPLLRDATARRAGGGVRPILPRVITVSGLLNGVHHAEFITLRGRVLDRTTRPAARSSESPAAQVTTWMVQNDDLVFTIEHEGRADDPGLAAIPIGSLIEADGVCFSQVNNTGKPYALQLLLPSVAGMRVLAQPSWLTPRRLLTGIGLLSVLLLVATLWSLTVSRKNAALNVAVQKLESAQRELQEAHDTLEQKVIERSAQLQAEMTTRKEAEVQFKAVLAERTRLARDLHDTLEQTLTGIALHLETAATLSRRSLGGDQHHLQLARTWLHQSQVQLRNSIWDLRSRELEQFDFADALRRSAELLVDGSGLALQFNTTGVKRPLPEIVEENLLRIGQEAMTNVVKHAGARQITVEIDYKDESVRLAVIDDGVGFDTSQAAAANHFGLLGVRERVRRMEGRFALESAPGRGTSLAVEVALDPLAASVGATPAAVNEEET